MVTRRLLTAGLGCSMAAALADAAAWASPTQETTVAPVAPPIEPLLLTGRLDASDRLTVPVFINGQGPFAFVVDTGADRSVMADSVAAGLDLPLGPNILMHGIAGADLIRTRQVAELRVGNARMRGVNLPTLPRERLGVDGLLGVDALQGSNVIMDFHKRKLELRAPTPRLSRARGRDVLVRADDQFGRLTVIDTQVGSVRTTAFIDSGGGVSIGNMALARALASRSRAPAATPVLTRLIGTTGHSVVGEVRVVPSLRVGDLRITNLPIVFCDLYVFEVWGRTRRPTLLLGADVLRMFARVELDFGAGAVLFRLGAAAPVGLA